MKTKKQHIGLLKAEQIAVDATYTLTKSADVSLISFYIGYTEIDLQSDQSETDGNTFATKSPKTYPCLKGDDGIKVVLRAKGKHGGFIELKISLDGKALAANPIELKTDNNGRLILDKILK